MHYLDSFVCPRPNSGSVTNREHFHGCPLEVSAAPPAAPPERSRSRPKNAPADENKDRESVWLALYLSVMLPAPSVAAFAVSTC